MVYRLFNYFFIFRNIMWPRIFSALFIAVILEYNRCLKWSIVHMYMCMLVWVLNIIFSVNQTPWSFVKYCPGIYLEYLWGESEGWWLSAAQVFSRFCFRVRVLRPNSTNDNCCVKHGAEVGQSKKPVPWGITKKETYNRKGK